MQHTNIGLGAALRSAAQRPLRPMMGTLSGRVLQAGVLIGAMGLFPPARVGADAPPAPGEIALPTTTITVNGEKIDVPVGATIIISGTTVTVGTTKIEVPVGTSTIIVGPTVTKTDTVPAVPAATTPATPAKPPSPSEAMLSQGRRAVRNVDYSGAEKSAQQSLTLAKTSAEKGNALMLLGQTFYSRRQYEAARAQWKRAATFGPEFVTRAHASNGRSFLAEGKTDTAIAEYQLVLSSVEADADLDAEDKGLGKLLASLPLAAIYLQRGQLETARAQFSQIARSNPGEPMISALGLLVIGGVEILQKNPQAALTSFQQVAAQLAKVTDKDKPLFSPEEVGALQGVLASAATKPKYQNLSGPEIGNKLLEILISSFGDGFDSLLDPDF